MLNRRGSGWRWAGAGIALALLVGIAALAYRSTAGFEEHARWVSHTHSVQLEIEEVQSQFARMRLYWRLYLITGDNAYQASFERTQRSIPSQIDHLKRLTRDSARQQQHLDALQSVLLADLDDLAAVAGSKREGRLGSPDRILAELATERPAVSTVIYRLQEMQIEEAGLLREREADAAQSARLTRVVIVVGNLLALTLLGATLWLLARENRERRRAQAEAQRYAREFQDLYDHAPCGYHSVDADGLIVRMNDTWLSWLGYSREEVVGRMRHPDLMTEASAQHFAVSAFPLFKRQGWLKEMEFEYLRKDGSTFPGSLSATTILDSDGDYATSRSVVIDISERKRVEAEVHAVNRELESFSYSVSHDLRTPLRAINGYAQMVEEDYGPQLDAEGRRLLATIRRSAARMGRLIDDLLAFSRLGRQPIVSASVDMDELARLAFEEHAAAYPAARLVPGKLPMVAGDPALLRQVWTNLVSNALKYSSRTEQPVVEVSGRREGSDCVYSVHDNGAGFDMRYYDKLFGVFQRLHGDSEFEGTGVGLAIVQRIVARHGGRVWAHAEPGLGATFHFALPESGRGNV